MKYLLLIAVLSFSRCITIKYLPPPCKKDTIYINEEPIYKSTPMWPNPGYIDTFINFRVTPYYQYPKIGSRVDTASWLNWSDHHYVHSDTIGWMKDGNVFKPITLSDTSYKKIAMKAQQMTNEKR